MALRIKELLDGQVNVVGNLPQEDRRNVSASMNRYGSNAAIRMTKLLVGTLLPNLFKTVPSKKPDNLAGTEDGDVAHGASIECDQLGADELGVQLDVAFFGEERDDLS